MSEATRASANITSYDKVWPLENNARIMVEDIAQWVFTENLCKGTHTAWTKTHQQFHWKSLYNRHHAGRWSLKANSFYSFLKEQRWINQHGAKSSDSNAKRRNTGNRKQMAKVLGWKVRNLASLKWDGNCGKKQTNKQTNEKTNQPTNQNQNPTNSWK